MARGSRTWQVISPHVAWDSYTESKTDQNVRGMGGMVITGEIKMTQQVENEEAKKLKDKTDSDEATEKRINHLAKEAAEKASKTEQRYDKDHSIFSK